MHKRIASITAIALTALLIGSPTSVHGFGGSGSKYETQQGGEIEFYESGQIKKISGNAKCTGVKVVVQPQPVPRPAPEPAPEPAPQPQGQAENQGRARADERLEARPIQLGVAAFGHIALQLPIDATPTLETFTDATLSTPLMIAGELVTWSPNQSVAAEAEAFAGPAQSGFAWVGFRTNPLMENVAGTFDQDFTWVVTFGEGGYPEPGAIGSHSVAVYVSDNAEDPDPLLEWHPVY